MYGIRALMASITHAVILLSTTSDWDASQLIVAEGNVEVL